MLFERIKWKLISSVVLFFFFVSFCCFLFVGLQRHNENKNNKNNEASLSYGNFDISKNSEEEVLYAKWTFNCVAKCQPIATQDKEVMKLVKKANCKKISLEEEFVIKYDKDTLVKGDVEMMPQRAYQLMYSSAINPCYSDSQWHDVLSGKDKEQWDPNTMGRNLCTHGIHGKADVKCDKGKYEEEMGAAPSRG